LNGVGVRADGAFRWSFRWSGVFKLNGVGVRADGASGGVSDGVVFSN
jgi:hypothetical protein